MKEVNLTEGAIFRKLIGFSLPMIAGNLLQQIYNLVDTLIAGKCIGPDALASVGSAYTLMIFITSIIIGLCMGSGAFFSNDYGAADERKLREDIWLSFWFILGLQMGVSGAAWATVIAQGMAGVGIMIYAIAKLPLLRCDIVGTGWNSRRLKEVISNDVATGIQQSVMNFGIFRKGTRVSIAVSAAFCFSGMGISEE